MSAFTILLDPSTARFYENVALAAGVSVEQVLSDALFKLAGELALEAIARSNQNGSSNRRCFSGAYLVLL